jgi:hypothetical protein
MGEDLDPLTTDALRKTNRGILLMMLVALALLGMAGFAFGGTRFGIGVLLGGGLAFINYRWLDRSTRGVLTDNAMASMSILTFKYVLRYFAVGALLLIVFWTDLLPVTSVIVGLSIFAIGVLAQGIRSIFTRS